MLGPRALGGHVHLSGIHVACSLDVEFAVPFFTLDWHVIAIDCHSVALAV